MSWISKWVAFQFAVGGVFLHEAGWAASAAPAWELRPGGRVAPLTVPARGRAGLTAMAPEDTGLRFTNSVSQEHYGTNQMLLNGSGLAAGDIDGDGRVDLYFCSLGGANRLYRNLGNWKFEEVTGQAGVGCPGQHSTGAVFADVDGDGDLDLLVSSLGRGVRLFLNDGHGRFNEATAPAGLASEAGGMTLALADVDGDGRLDLFVANTRTDTFQDRPPIRFRIAMAGGRPVITMVDGKPVATTPGLANRYFVGEGNRIGENGEPPTLLLNRGGAQFSPVSWTGGSFLDEDGKPLAAPPCDWGNAGMFRDLNGDGAPDLYVCNDTQSPDRIWINDGQGRFRAIPRLALRQTSFSSMGVDFADLNRDGFDEIFVTDMLAREHTNRQTQLLVRRPPAPPGVIENRPDYQHNTLFLNRGDGTYAEIAQACALDATDWTWSPVFLDVDLDGYEDLLITTGIERNLLHADTRRRLDLAMRQQQLSLNEFVEARKAYRPFAPPKFAFRNRGDLTFEDTSAAWGFDSPRMCPGDLPGRPGQRRGPGRGSQLFQPGCAGLS